MHQYTCDEVTDAAPRFALDILEPDARAGVAAHLLRCPPCRARVSGMEESAARLLDLSGPDPGPGAGWGDRLEDPYPAGVGDGAGTQVRPGRRRLRTVLTLAAATVLAVGSTFGPEIEQASSRTGSLAGRAAIMADGRRVGTASLYAGPTPTVEVQLQGISGSHLTCEVVTTDGTATTLGRIDVRHGRATWVAGYRSGPAPLTGLLLLDPDGHVVAQAVLG